MRKEVVLTSYLILATMVGGLLVHQDAAALPSSESGTPLPDTLAQQVVLKAPSRAPRQISLLIGVGQYKWAREWRDLQNLEGPARDVVRMQDAIQRWGFGRGADVQRILVDEQASKAGIAQAFQWLASQATGPDDVVVIYYSGHGSWAPDRAIDKIRTRDEHLATPGDTIDEALVPWDARDAHDPLQLVLDDEIGHWLDQLGTGNVTMIVDACFSGTITRGTPDLTSASAPRARGPRAPDFSTLSGGGGMLEGQKSMGHTLITAASAYELAYEKMFQPGNTVAGVLTRHLADALDGAGPTMRFDDLIAQVRTKVGQNQTPQLEGDRGARIFKVGAGVVIPERGYASVRAVRGARVELAVGAIHGVRQSTVYDVFRPNETQFRSGRLAQLRVDSVTERVSFASVIGSATNIPVGARATLSQVPPGALALDRLRVFVDPSAAAVRAPLRALSWLEITDQPSRAVAEIRQRGGVTQVLMRGHELPPLARDDSEGHARRAVVGRDSVRGYAGTLAALCEPLRRGFSVAAMEMVRNDRPPSQLKVEVRVLPANVTPPVRRQTAVDTTYVGDLYNVWAWVELPPAAVANSPLYLSAAVAGYTAAPAVLWPQGNRTNTRLTPEQVNMPLLLFSNVRMSPVTGVETLKIVVNSDPFDLRPLVAALPSCPVTRNVTAARGEWTSEPMTVTGWTASERLVEIHPARR